MNSIINYSRRIINFTGDVIDKQRTHKPSLSIYCYHSFEKSNWDFSISTDIFKSQLEYLLSISSPIEEKDILSFVYNQKKIKRSSFLLTIDDGYKNVEEIISITQQYKIKPLLFVIAGSKNVNRRVLQTKLPLLSDTDIQSISNIWDIGCHSMTHEVLTRLSNDHIREQIGDAKEKLEGLINRKIYSFSYPKGRYNQQIISHVKESGFELGFSMDDHLIHHINNPFAIPRIGVNRYHDLSEFKTLSSPTVINIRHVFKKMFGEIYE